MTALFEKRHDVNQPANVGYDVTHLTQPQFHPAINFNSQVKKFTVETKKMPGRLFNDDVISQP